MNLKQVRSYAVQLLREELPTHLVYHGVEHTMDDVVPAAQRYARLSNLSAEDSCLLETAAVLHDLGYLSGTEGHEETSAQMAARVLPGMGYQAHHIARVQAMIRATRLPHSPRTTMEALLCDADLDIIGRGEFVDRSRRLRQELANLGQVMSDARWCARQWAFLHDHRFHTDVARQLRAEGKRRNQEMLFSRLVNLHRNGSDPVIDE